MSSSSDEDFSLLFDSEEEQAIAAVCLVANCLELVLPPGEMDGENQEYVDKEEGVRDVLATLRRTPSLFKALTNFSAEEFEDLCISVCPVIFMNARSTGAPKSHFGRQPKLSPAQRLLHFIMYLKHDNVVRYDAFSWNWSKSSSCDDSIFVASCIEHALPEELRWPTAAERRELGRTLAMEFLGCLGFIDGTLVEIRCPVDPSHRRFFNGRKKIYSLNSTVVVDHNGLFIFVDPGYPGSFHDVNILRQSSLYKNWRQHFAHTDNYFEFLLGDPGYVGEEMFIMRRFDRRDMVQLNSEELSAVEAYNAMHGGLRVKVEWGIGGLKRKWKRLMKRFDARREKFDLLFKAAAILTNFIHRRRMDMHAYAEGDRDNDEDHYGWEGDF